MMHDRVEGMLTMSSGYQLHWEPNGVGGRRFISDETPPGVLVWDTTLCSPQALYEALRIHQILEHKPLEGQIGAVVAELAGMRIKRDTDYSITHKCGNTYLTANAAFVPTILEIADKHNVSFQKIFEI